MPKKPKRERKSVEYARALLELPGLTLREISERTGYDITALSYLALAFGLSRKPGRRTKPGPKPQEALS